MGWLGRIIKLLFVDDEVFLSAIANTIKFAHVTGPIGYIMAFLLAWLISQIPVKYRFLYTLSSIIRQRLRAAVAISVIWTVLILGRSLRTDQSMDDQFGIINEPFLWFGRRTIMPV